MERAGERQRWVGHREVERGRGSSSRVGVGGICEKLVSKRFIKNSWMTHGPRSQRGTRRRGIQRGRGRGGGTGTGETGRRGRDGEGRGTEPSHRPGDDSVVYLLTFYPEWKRRPSSPSPSMAAPMDEVESGSEVFSKTPLT